MKSVLIIFGILVAIVILCLFCESSREGFAPMQLLYSDVSGNLSSSSNIEADSINVIGYGDIKTKMMALKTEIEGIIAQGKRDIEAQVAAQNTSITQKINNQDTKVTNQLDDCVKKSENYRMVISNTYKDSNPNWWHFPTYLMGGQSSTNNTNFKAGQKYNNPYARQINETNQYYAAVMSFEKADNPPAIPEQR